MNRIFVRPRWSVQFLAALAACREEPDGRGRDPVLDPGEPGDTACEAQMWYADGDGDGVGSDEATVLGCAAPDGYVEDGGDCDDTDPGVSPGTREVQFDGVDQNCSGSGDDGNCPVGAAVEVDCEGLTVPFGAGGIDFDGVDGECRSAEIVNRCLEPVDLMVGHSSDTAAFWVDGLERVLAPGAVVEVGVWCEDCHPSQGDAATLGTLMITPSRAGVGPVAVPLRGLPNGPNDS